MSVMLNTPAIYVTADALVSGDDGDFYVESGWVDWHWCRVELRQEHEGVAPLDRWNAEFDGSIITWAARVILDFGWVEHSERGSFYIASDSDTEFSYALHLNEFTPDQIDAVERIVKRVQSRY